MVCIWYQCECDLVIFTNWSRLRPAESGGLPLSNSNKCLQSSGSMATEILAGLLGFFPLQGLFDLSGSLKSLSNVGMWFHPKIDWIDWTVFPIIHVFCLFGLVNSIR